MERMRRGREGGMMADGGGTFRCATMLCGNNAQTNDSAVPTVITRGTRSFFPLLNPLSQPPSNQLSFYVYPFVPLSFLVSLVHLPIHVYTGLPLSLSLSNVPRPSSSTPFSLLWLLNQRTSATTIDPPTLEPPPRLSGPPKYSRFHSRSLPVSLDADREKRARPPIDEHRSFLQDFLCAP